MPHRRASPPIRVRSRYVIAFTIAEMERLTGGAAMTRLDDELKINAAQLRQGAKAAEAEWCAAQGIERLSIKRGAEDRASR